MKKIIARIALFLGRYKLVNRPPDEPVMLLIAAPHTSNWDFMLMPVSYTHLRAHETVLDLVCRLLLEKKNNNKITIEQHNNQPKHQT